MAVTMVSAGVIASLSVKHIGKRWSGFGTFARGPPYVSAGLILIFAACMAYTGWSGLVPIGAV